MAPQPDQGVTPDARTNEMNWTQDTPRPKSGNARRPIVAAAPPKRALRDIQRLARELNQPIAAVTAMVIMLGLERVRENWRLRVRDAA